MRENQIEVRLKKECICARHACAVAIMFKKKQKKDYKKLVEELRIQNLEKLLQTRHNDNPTDQQRERTVDLRNRATSAERYVDRLLQASDIKYVFQKIIENPFSYYIVDFFFPETKTCLELDGRYHNKLTQFNKDKKRDAYLKQQGYTIIRLKNKHAFEKTLEWFKNRGIPKK